MFTVVRKDLDTVQIFVTAPDSDDARFDHEVVLEMNTTDAESFANRILNVAGLSWSPEVAE